MNTNAQKGYAVELLLIGDSKLKIVLDKEEMEKYKLATVSAETCDSGFRRSFWKLLERAKEEVDFDTGGDKILIQFYPLQDGGCEIFVTKLGLLSDASARMVARSDKVTLLSRNVGIYAFSSLDDAVSVCRLISKIAGESTPISDLYQESGRFYLSIDEYGKGGEAMEFPFISEYGSSVSEDALPYLFEHAGLLAKENAVKRLSEI